MDKAVQYKDTVLMKGSKALELYTQWKKSGDSKDRKKLDDHVKEVAQRDRDLMERYK